MAVLFSLAAVAPADIDYTVTIRPPDTAATATRMTVSMKIPVESARTQIQIPNWGPGSYVYPNPELSTNVQDFKANVNGKDVEAIKPNDYTWTIPTQGARTVTVSYTVPVQISEEIGHYRGPASYMYVVDRKNEKCNLTIDVPPGWNLATGLDGTNGHFSAPTYDVLADNPVTFGKYREVRYTVDGRPHILAMYGAARNDVDVDKLVNACSFISAAENDFWGNKPPYSHYVWHFNVNRRPDGGGGLEHLASTEITLANGLGPGIIGVNAHEFFHLWNVKRIRARVLGPFDYTKLPETGALWWLEGITEYYAHQLMTRYGYWDDKKWYATMATDLQRVRANPARLEVGPYEASFRVKDANNGRGNSNGYRISYYDLGVIAGICLDLELITQTNGKHSLDDVAHALWEECKDGKPGFEEDEIRNQLIRFGGPSMGPFYDKVIMHGGEMPVEEELAKVGIRMQSGSRDVADFGLLPAIQASGMRVSKVVAGAQGKLKVDDIVLKINGTPVQSVATYNAAKAAIKPGDTATLTVKRGDSTEDVQVVAAVLTSPLITIQDDEAATAQQKQLRDFWLYRGKKGWKPPVVKPQTAGR